MIIAGSNRHTKEDLVMSTNENWTKVKYSYVCGSCGVGLREGDLAIMLDGEILCEDCALGRYGTVPCMIHERKPRRIYYPKDYPELANGIYRFGKVHGMLLMTGCIEHGDKAAVKKAVEAGEAVLEKRSEGLMIRFPGKLICPADKIDLDDIEYDDVNYLFAGGYSPDMKLICSEGRAIGICAMNRSEAYKVSFTCYERGGSAALRGGACTDEGGQELSGRAEACCQRVHPAGDA